MHAPMGTRRHWISTGDRAAFLSPPALQATTHACPHANKHTLDLHGRRGSVSLASGIAGDQRCMLACKQAHVGSPRATRQRFRHCRRATMHARMQRSTRWISTGDEVATGPSRVFLASGRSVTPGLARCHRWTHCPWRTQHPGTAILLRVVPASQLRLARRLAMRCTLLAMRCTLLAMRNTRTILQCGPPGISSLKKKLSPPVKKAALVLFVRPGRAGGLVHQARPAGKCLEVIFLPGQY